MHPHLSFTHASPDFASLARALGVSFALHAVLIVSADRLFSQKPPAPKSREDLRVRLLPPPALPDPAPPQPLLKLDPRTAEDNPRKAAPALLQKPVPRIDSKKAPRETAVLTRPRSETSQGGLPMLAGEAARRAGEQIAKELFYPPEAIERGLEGETLVLVFLDDAGNAIAARVESSSGHALLDTAAVRAARTLKALPASAPREAVLPVRFRLR